MPTIKVFCFLIGLKQLSFVEILEGVAVVFYRSFCGWLAVSALVQSCMPGRFDEGIDGAGSESLASFQTETPRGRAQKTYRSPSGLSEICVLPNPFPGVTYDNDDAQTEDELCSANLYKAEGTGSDGAAVAMCPKMSSTFPGVELYELENQNKARYESELCEDQNNRPTSRIAKFKQSVSCSYRGQSLATIIFLAFLGAQRMCPWQSSAPWIGASMPRSGSGACAGRAA